MKIGFSGLGKMGSNMVARLLEHGHEVVVLNRSPEPVNAAVSLGAEAASDYKDLVNKLNPVIVWLMLPEDVTEDHFNELLGIVPSGATIIDGGNSNFNNSIRRAKLAAKQGVHFLDVGTSGGILGRKQGYALMVGGQKEAADRLAPIFESLAPPSGWGYMGPAGSGHYVKMIHNGIEYGMMESLAEGYRLLKEGPVKKLDLGQIASVWQHGSIVESLLNDLAGQALAQDPDLSDIEGVVAESGEARWTLETARQANIDMPAIQTSFDVRLKSQSGQTNFATKLLAAMRNKFGGHQLNP